LNAVDAFQNFVDTFDENASDELKATMQYVYEFVLAAAGHDELLDLVDQGDSPRSQLTCEIETIPFDLIIAGWAIDQFGGILHHMKNLDNIKAQAQPTLDYSRFIVMCSHVSRYHCKSLQTLRHFTTPNWNSSWYAIKSDYSRKQINNRTNRNASKPSQQLWNPGTAPIGQQQKQGQVALQGNVIQSTMTTTRQQKNVKGPLTNMQQQQSTQPLAQQLSFLQQ